MPRSLAAFTAHAIAAPPMATPPPAPAPSRAVAGSARPRRVFVARFASRRSGEPRRAPRASARGATSRA